MTLAERLRAEIGASCATCRRDAQIHTEAAARIETLEALLRRMLIYAEAISQTYPETTFFDVEAARAALEPKP